MLEFRVLGSSDLRGPEREEIGAVLAQPKRLALLAYLAVATPPGLHRRDKVVALFWPDSDQEHARNSLSQALHFLRRSIGEEVIGGRGTEEVGLDFARIRCDVAEFEEALASGDLDAALELYQGDLLEGFFLSDCPEFEQWLDGERVRLRERAASAAWSLAHRQIGLGQITEGERTAQRALALVCTDENEVRSFIAAIAEAGDRAAAIQFFEKFAARLRDELDLEPDRETRALVEKIRTSTQPLVPGQPPERIPISDVRATELYLKARHGILTFSKEGMESAKQQLQQALEIVGDNPVLTFQLAHLHFQFWNLGIRLDEEDLHLAREYAEQALALDPHSPDHLVIRGLLEVTGGIAVRGLTYLEAALERNATHPEALFYSAHIWGLLGRDLEANTRWEQFRRIDPLNPLCPNLPIWIEIKVGRFESALELALPITPGHEAAGFYPCAHAMALAQLGRLREAARVIREVYVSRDELYAKCPRALSCAFEGDRDGVLRQLDGDFERWAVRDFQASEWAADALALVGESERALEWLENSVDLGNINYPYLSEYDHLLDNLRGEARFNELMERVKREWDDFDVRRLPSSFPPPP